MSPHTDLVCNFWSIQDSFCILYTCFFGHAVPNEFIVDFFWPWTLKWQAVMDQSWVSGQTACAITHSWMWYLCVGTLLFRWHCLFSVHRQIFNVYLQSSKSKSANTGQPKTVSSKHGSKADAGKQRGTLGSHGKALAPPMSSVVVERHQPVTKVSAHKV